MRVGPGRAGLASSWFPTDNALLFYAGADMVDGNMGTGGVESREMAGTRGAGRKHEGLLNRLSCDWHLNGH
jgi:hypothetical protein